MVNFEILWHNINPERYWELASVAPLTSNILSLMAEQEQDEMPELEPAGMLAGEIEGGNAKSSIQPPPRSSAFAGTTPGVLPPSLPQCQTPHVPGVVYESLVDRLAGAFLAHYFPATHQFLLQPQHTFRREAPEAALREVGESQGFRKQL
ncbi:hypothetical protein B0H10DRAFT_2240104 [Mycena sp. CBHHK59/15]|nr:hypothetical protein B0H10DRAFT_2240104 [Mycena sp. CBHHK59/15]